MKKLLTFLFLLITTNLFAIQLPEGTDARVTRIQQTGDVITFVYLKEPTIINTPVGKMEVYDEVYFYESGKVKSVRPSNSGVLKLSIGELPYSDYYNIEFYENGKVKSFYLNNETLVKTSVGEINIKYGEVYLYENGLLYSCELAECKSPINTPIGNIYPSKYSKIFFYKNGSLDSVVTDEVLQINVLDKIFYVQAGKEIYFSEDKKLQSFTTKLNKIKINNFDIDFSNTECKLAIYSDNSMLIIPYSEYYYDKLLINKKEFSGSRYALFIPPFNNRIYLWKTYERDYYYNGSTTINLLEHKNEELTKTSIEFSNFTFAISPSLYNPPLFFDAQGNITSYYGYDEVFNEAKDIKEKEKKYFKLNK